MRFLSNLLGVIAFSAMPAMAQTTSAPAQDYADDAAINQHYQDISSQMQGRYSQSLDTSGGGDNANNPPPVAGTPVFDETQLSGHQAIIDQQLGQKMNQAESDSGSEVAGIAAAAAVGAIFSFCTPNPFALCSAGRPGRKSPLRACFDAICP